MKRRKSKKDNFVWFGRNIYNYDAIELKDKILETLMNDPDRYEIGILLGKQPNGSYVVCINIDMNGECKEKAKNKLVDVLTKYNIIYHLETTPTGEYHIFVILDKLTESLKKTTKIIFTDECMKNKNGKTYRGKIELLGANKPYPILIYNGIINDKEPFIVYPIIVNQAEQFEKAILEFQFGV
jgi:hypothetical protein